MIMKNSLLLLCCFLGLLISCKSDGAGCREFASPTDNPAVMKSGDWDRLGGDGFYIINGIWGKGGITDYKQYIYKANNGSIFPMGWKWHWPRKNSNQVKSYPHIACGQNPWENSSTNRRFPIRVDKIHKMVVSYDITHCVNGKYNLSFDLWITKTPDRTSPPEENIVREVMIWLDYEGRDCLPRNWFARKVTIDGEVYRLYIAKNRSQKTGTGGRYTRDYFAFLKEEPEYSGQTDIAEFLRYLAARKYILPAEYLRNINLGNEIWYGSGETIVNNFQLSIK
jgi:hypothetical protein